MRQAGILAAAGIVALEQHVERLAEDHEKADLLAAGLREIDGLTVDEAAVQTNMVFIDVADGDARRLPGFLRGCGILVMGRGCRFRLVTHLDVDREDVAAVVAAFRKYYNRKQRRKSP
jgi:threonine aldolase